MRIGLYNLEPKIVNTAMMQCNLDHMASTRAANRALRNATAFGYCSAEELPDGNEEAEIIDASWEEGE